MLSSPFINALQHPKTYSQMYLRTIQKPIFSHFWVHFKNGWMFSALYAIIKHYNYPLENAALPKNKPPGLARLSFYGQKQEFCL